MKRFAVLFACLFLCHFVFAGGPDIPEFNWEDAKIIKGGPMECTISIMGEEAGMMQPSKASYDAKGRLVKYTQPWETMDFSYDSASRLVEIKRTGKEENGADIPYGKTVYTYDAKGKLKKIGNFDPEGGEYLAEEGITYDKNGNIKIERLTPEGSVMGIDTYNKDMDLIESMRYTGPSVAMGEKKKDIESQTIITYDKNRNVISRVRNNITPMYEGAPKKITQQIKYTFDKNGNKLTMKTTLTPKDAAGPYGFLALPPYQFTYGSGTGKTQDTKPKEDKTTGKDKVGAKVQVEYNDAWYPATVLKQENGKYYIHYDDYDDSWDEWVTEERIKF
jgi:YD repeat-containing protein